MTQAQFDTRKERSENGALIASATEEGFRVYSLQNPSPIYLVRKDGDRWTCTCPDFEVHRADTTWRCKHILAVVPWEKREQAATLEPGNGHVVEMPAAGEQNEPPQTPPATPKKRTRKGPNGSTQMLIKRSVSPDGRIDSVSVEFSMPVSDISNGEIKEKALKILQLQKEIVGSFLQLNGQKGPAATAASSVPVQQGNQGNGDGKPVFARMIDIGRVNGKWGERLCINLQVNGRWSRIFGSADQLAMQIARAGHHIDPQNIDQGLRLNLACLVITKPSDDGRYLNVERVLSLPKRGGNNGPATN
jgi:SWIM zinc finger